MKINHQVHRSGSKMEIENNIQIAYLQRFKMNKELSSLILQEGRTRILSFKHREKETEQRLPLKNQHPY